MLGINGFVIKLCCPPPLLQNTGNKFQGLQRIACVELGLHLQRSAERPAFSITCVPVPAS